MSIYTETVNVEIIEKGANSLIGDINTLIKEIGNLEKYAENAGVSLQNTFKLDTKKTLSEINGIAKAIEDLKERLNGHETVDGGELVNFKNISKDLTDVKQRIKGISNLTKGTATGAIENINSIIKSFKELGVADDTIKKIQNNFVNLQKVFKDTGVSKSLMNYSGNLTAMYTTLSKINDLKLKTKNFTFTNTTKFNDKATDLFTQVSSGNLGNKQTHIKLNNLTTDFKELKDNESYYVSLKKRLINNAEKNLNTLITQRDTIVSLLNKNENNLNSQIIKTVETYLAELNSDIAKLQSLPSKIKSYKSTKGLKYQQDNPIVDMNANKVSFDTIKSSIFEGKYLKGNLEDIKKLIYSYNEFKKIVSEGFPTELSDKFKTYLDGIKSQLDKLQTKIKTGSVDKSYISDYEKRMELIKKTLNYETELYYQHKNGIISDSEFKKTTSSLDAFNKSILSSNTSLKELQFTFNEIKMPQLDKMDIDKDYTNIINNYKKFASVLNSRLSNPKLFLSQDSINSTKISLEEIEKAIVKATEEKLAFDRAFEQNPKIAVSDYKAQLQAQKNNYITTKENYDEVRFLPPGETPLSTKFSRAALNVSLYGGLYNIAYAAINAFENAGKAVVQYSEDVSMLNAILHDNTKSFEQNKESAAELEQTLLSLGGKYGGLSEDINKTAMILARGGIKKDDLVKSTEIAMKLAKLTGDTFESSANAIMIWKQTFGNSEGIIGKDALSMEKLGDTLAYVANETRANTEDINTFSNYALEASLSAGLTTKSVGAMFIAFNKAGMTVSTAGTSVRKFTELLGNNSNEIQNLFEKIGINQQLLAQRMRLGGSTSDVAFTDFISKLHDLNNEEYRVLTRGMEIHDKMVLDSLRNNYTEIVKNMKNISGNIQGELDKSKYAIDNLGDAWQRLMDNMKTTWVSMVHSLHIEEFFTGLVNGINNVFYGTSLQGVIDNINKDDIKKYNISVTSSDNAAGLNITDNDLEEALKKVVKVLEKNNITLLSTDPKIQLQELKHELQVTRDYEAKVKSYHLTPSQNVEKAITALKNTTDNWYSYTNKTAQETAALTAVSAFSKVGSNDFFKPTVYFMPQRGQDKIVDNFIGNFQNYIKDKKYSEKWRGKTISGVSFTDCSLSVKDVAKKALSIDIGSTTASQITQAVKKGYAIVDYRNNPQPINKNILPYLQRGNLIYLKDKKSSSQHVVVYTGNGNIADMGVSGGHADRNLLQTFGKTHEVIAVTDPISNFTNNLTKQSKAIAKATDKINLATSTMTKNGKFSMDSFSKNLTYEKNITVFKKDISDYVNDMSKSVQTMINTAKDKSQAPTKNLALQLKSMLNGKIDYANPGSVQDFIDKLTSFKAKNQDDSDIQGKVATIVEGLNDYKTKLDSLINAHEAIKKMDTAYDIPPHEALSTELKNKMAIIDAKETAEKEKQLKSIQNNTLYINKDNEITQEKINATEDNINKLKKTITDVSNKLKNAQDDYNNAEKNSPLDTTLLSTKDSVVSEQRKELTSLQDSLRTNEESLDKLRYALLQNITVAKQKYRKDIEQPYNELIKKDYSKSFIDQVNESFAYLTDNALSFTEKSALIKKQTSLDDYDFTKGSTAQELNKARTTSIATMTPGIELINAKEGVEQTYSRLVGRITEQIEEIKAIAKLVYGVSDIKSIPPDEIINMEKDKYNALLDLQKEYNQQSNQLDKIRQEQEIATRRMTFEAQLANANTVFNTMANMSDAYYAISGKKSKAAFRAYQAMQVAQTIISTYSSAQSAYDAAMKLGPVGLWLAPIAAAGTIAAGMAKVAAIKQQTYHTGGYVDKDNRNHLRNDEVPAILQTGEYVLSRQDMKNIKEGNNLNNSKENQQKNEFIIINSMDTSIIEQYMTSRAGRQVIHNIINK